MKCDTAFLLTQVPVTILTTHGDIDGSNYQELIRMVAKLFQDGTRNLVLDLGDTPFISSSGLVALQSITLILNGDKPVDTENGWAALHDIGEGLGDLQTHLKLLNVQPRVDRTLTISGLKSFYEIYSDRDSALASFSSPE